MEAAVKNVITRKNPIYTGSVEGKTMIKTSNIKINHLKVIFLTALVLGLLAFGLPAAAQSQDNPTLTVLAEALNIRSGPDLNYPAFDTLTKGATVAIIGHNPQTGWWQVTSSYGSPGWVSGNPEYVSINGDTSGLSNAPSLIPDSHSPLPNPQSTGTLVFQTASGGAIYVINQDGTNLRYLTTGMDPALSPDGQQVAFVRWDGAEFGTLYTINLDGSEERAIVGGTRQAKSPTWSADGQEIILSFQHGGLRGPVEICREYDTDDGFRWPDDIGEITKSRRSADGFFVLCYIPREDLRWGLRRINVTTGQFEDLPHDQYSISPTWNPAQPWQLVYDGARGLVSLDLNQGTSWPLTEDIQDHGPVISPDGTRVAITYRQDNEHWDIHLLTIEGRERSRLTETSYATFAEQILAGQAPHTYNNVAPAWSPDGSQIAFLTDRTSQSPEAPVWEIWVMNADGSNQRPLFPAGTLAGITFQYDGMGERVLSWQ